MDLLCGESSPPTFVEQFLIPNNDEHSFAMTYTAFDLNILSDDRILKQLLQIEERYVPNGVLESYKCIQSEVEPYMRKIVANWMLEVCEELNCEEVVFPLAMNYLDRFLVSTDIRKCQLQLVGVVCLLIASKLRQCLTLHPEVLSYFTDYSVSVQEITTWELLVLRRLKWDVSAVVATDYLDHLFTRLPVCFQNNETSLNNNNIDSIIRRHSSTFIALCTTELQFSCHVPSLIAAASVATAVHGLQSEHKPWKSFEKFLNTLENILGIDASRIQSCVNQIESVISSNTELAQKFVAHNSTFNTKNYKENEQIVDQFVKYEVKICTDIEYIDDTNNYKSQKDIQNIYF